MILGIAAALVTGALWGLTFVAAKAVAPFSAVDFAMVRYGIFGVASLLLMLHPAFRPVGMARPVIATGLMLGGFGYVGYFLVVSAAVAAAGPAIPPLIVGALPLVLAVLGNRGSGRVPWTPLLPPLALVASGLVTVNLAGLAGATPAAAPAALGLGVLLSFVALATWTAYAVVNARIMGGAGAPSALGWTGLQGVGALVGSLALLPLSSWGLGAPSAPPTVEEGRVFLAWALLLGLAGSWLATWTWMIAARRLPLALAAQLIVAETVFGLGFGFLLDERLPIWPEAIGAGLQIAGVIAAIRVFTRRRHPPPEARRPAA